MINNCFKKYLKKPAFYQESSELFWNVEHISQKLLEAHLNPDFEGASRNPQFMDKSVLWIQQMVSPLTFTKLLDFGCGPGLYAERFAKAGYQVTGIDISQNSIAYAKKEAQKKNLNISYLNENYLTFHSEDLFDFATLIYCDYGALSTPHRSMILKTIYQSLKRGGKFLLDVFTIHKFNDFKESCTWELCPEGGFWSPKEYLCMNGNYKYLDATTLEQTVVFTEEKPQVYYIWNHYFTAESLIAEVQTAGFRLVECFGDVAGSPYNSQSPTLAVLLQK